MKMTRGFVPGFPFPAVADDADTGIVSGMSFDFVWKAEMLLSYTDSPSLSDVGQCPRGVLSMTSGNMKSHLSS